MQLARATDEQLKAESVFKVADGSRKRSLIDVYAFPSTTEVQFFCDSDEVAKVSQLDDP